MAKGGVTRAEGARSGVHGGLTRRDFVGLSLKGGTALGAGVWVAPKLVSSSVLLTAAGTDAPISTQGSSIPPIPESSTTSPPTTTDLSTPPGSNAIVAAAAPADSNLPMTGTNVATLIAVGGAATLGGRALLEAARRRHAQASDDQLPA